MIPDMCWLFTITTRPMYNECLICGERKEWTKETTRDEQMAWAIDHYEHCKEER